MAHITRRRFLQAIALGFGAVAARDASQPARALARATNQAASRGPRIDLSSETQLAPGVQEFIKDTYLSHAAEFPDPNETVDVLWHYLEGNELLRRGQVTSAMARFQATIALNPNSRHAHAGLGTALWRRYQESQSEADLRRAVQHLVRAAEIGMNYGRVRYTDLLAKGLGVLGEGEKLERLFRRATEIGDRPSVVALDYAEGLRLLEDGTVESAYQAALRLQPPGDINALVAYAEWLIDGNRYEEAITILDPAEHKEYPHFLRGVALELLGRSDEARAEYDIYRPFNQMFPAPAKYRIPGSRMQQGLLFDDADHHQRGGSHCQAHVDLADVIHCEADGESEGGKRAVGWTVRTRVFKGTIWCCLSVDNSGSTLCEKYYNVIHQPYQFALCGHSDPTSEHVAYDVWWGYAPDPLTGFCACGSYSGDPCDASVHCSCGAFTGASTYGPMWFYGTSGTCPDFTCRHNHGKICGNGGSDNCFYNNHCPNNDCC